jgi:chromosomal replication initiation ATPase DnaA
MEIAKSELLQMIDDVIPELIQTRDKIDRVVIHLKSFGIDNKVSDKGKLLVIIRAIYSQLGVTLEELKSRNRITRVRKARQIYCALARSVTKMSLEEIAKKIDKKHCTVIHSCNVVKNARDTRDILYDDYEMVEVVVLDILNNK